jgi:hypothetical protein
MDVFSRRRKTSRIYIYIYAMSYSTLRDFYYINNGKSRFIRINLHYYIQDKNQLKNLSINKKQIFKVDTNIVHYFDLEMFRKDNFSCFDQIKDLEEREN